MKTKVDPPKAAEQEAPQGFATALGEVPPAADLAALEKALKKKAQKAKAKCGCWENS